MAASSSGGNWDLNTLVEVLTQGEEDLVRLDARLASQWPAAEQEKQLLLRAQSCFSQAICMVKAACSGRPTGAASEQVLREEDRREMYKKRKTMKKWTSRVHVSGLGAHNYDEYSWRKYGQKKILGANHPRAYFRCTHKSTTGCQAMKQVQQSNDDPAVIEITYRGEHTCVERLKERSSGVESSLRLPDQDQSLLLSFRSPKVETDAGSSMEERKPSSFTFASTLTRDGFSLPFLSPTTTTTTTTTESKCFSAPSPPWLTSELAPATNAGTASELAEVVAAAAPANQYDPYAMDVGFMLDSGGFDPNFSFDL